MDVSIFGLLDFQTIIMVMIGVFCGIVFGVIPGLTATMGIALFIPFTFALPPVDGISLLLGVYVGGIYGGSVTAILIRTPGTPSSAATVLDGYPMTENGEAGRALKYATVSSFVGGIFSCLVMLLVAPKIAAVGLQFGAPEFFALAIFGLSVVGSVSGENITKGLIAACLGLFISTIGLDPIGGTSRFSFDSMSLLSGVSLIPALIGLFAVSQVLHEVEKKSGENLRKPKYVSNKVPLKEMFSKWIEFLRASVIGTIVGLIPGSGTSIATFISYNESKRFSKTPEEYGKGKPEGVIATEASNNAVTGGALIPLLTLGIPGDVVTAIILGGFLVQGLTPGPMLFANNPEIVYGIFITIIVANIFMLFFGLAGIRLFAHIVKVPKKLLLPIVVIFCLIGSYAITNNIFDIWVVLAFSVIGYYMEKFKYPLPPLILGVVLGPIIESNLRRALIQSQQDISIFFTKPISAIFLSIVIISIFFPIFKYIWKSMRSSHAS